MYRLSAESPLGRITAAEENGKITHLCLSAASVPLQAQEKETPLLRETLEQIRQYFQGQRKTFHLPLNPSGTPFQQKVWQALLGVSYGHTATYGDIARYIAQSKACRAVGMACNRNPIAIIIPCHRIVGSGGKLTGYAAGLAIKKKLLDLEKNFL